eukprot:CAMPEP_0171891274 /NCGR_PEP_ID=MMETSP0992-20121227/44646_1 /TAXON_ID=483369 /ORGANISM="non described non described, Strain CCMP2098" /LENGTH=69 /DNA_ID=CAMNT_0012518587 /DNA_START=347 /DNA_END=553 /DNA_ORIENTATION=-
MGCDCALGLAVFLLPSLSKAPVEIIFDTPLTTEKAGPTEEMPTECNYWIHDSIQANMACKPRVWIVVHA